MYYKKQIYIYFFYINTTNTVILLKYKILYLPYLFYPMICTNHIDLNFDTVFCYLTFSSILSIHFVVHQLRHNCNRFDKIIFITYILISDIAGHYYYKYTFKLNILCKK